MATTTLNHSASQSILRTLAAPFIAIGNTLIAIGEASSRSKQVEFLNSLSDSQLADRGMTRETIVRHVFSDKMGI
ncbi:hypothetical protein NBRC116601_18960 [Cognatishimia sp. WU-CL00825]|uniref:DUF1127 domain-containing protein n=1 Tax=Cognatishimia sp. WU-CL00825 TaxID=3127658 RepID=UPI0031031B18